MSWLSRLRAAERLVDEQRANSALDTEPVSPFEEYALYELERLQRAVKGEADPQTTGASR